MKMRDRLQRLRTGFHPTFWVALIGIVLLTAVLMLLYNKFPPGGETKPAVV